MCTQRKFSICPKICNLGPLPPKKIINWPMKSKSICSILSLLPSCLKNNYNNLWIITKKKKKLSTNLVQRNPIAQKIIWIICKQRNPFAPKITWITWRQTNIDNKCKAKIWHYQMYDFQFTWSELWSA